MGPGLRRGDELDACAEFTHISARSSVIVRLVIREEPHAEMHGVFFRLVVFPLKTQKHL
jgi:hypothetical protein